MRRSAETGAPSIWRMPGAARLLIATACASTARWAYNVGLPAYIYGRTLSAAFVAFVAVARYVPPLVLTPVTAELARIRRRRLFFAGCDVVAALTIAVMAVLSLSDAPIGVVIALAAICSTATRARSPIATTTMLDLIDEDRLVSLNVVSQTTESAAVIIGPLVATGLLVWSGTTAVFAFAAALFCGSAALVAGVVAGKHHDDEPVSWPSIWRGMQVGFTRLYGTSDARMFTAFAVAASTLLGVDTVLLVVFADRRLGDGTSGYGLLLAAIGVGGLVGVLVVDRISATRRPGRALVRGLVCCALPTVALVPVHSAPPAFAIEVVSGIGSMATATLASVGFQRSMPPRTLSGAIAAFHTVLLLGLVLGAAVTPLLLNRGGLDAALVVVGLAFPTVGVACTPLLRRLDTDSAVILDGLAPRVTVLEGLAVLEHARHPTLERLASAAAIVRLDAGLVVIAEGDPADAFYALVDGDVEVTKAEGAADRVVARLSGPDYFGEIGLLRRIPRTATVSTITACTVLRIAGADFLAALAEGSPSAMLVDTVVTRLGQLTHDDRSGSG